MVTAMANFFMFRILTLSRCAAIAILRTWKEPWLAVLPALSVDNEWATSEPRRPQSDQRCWLAVITAASWSSAELSADCKSGRHRAGFAGKGRHRRGAIR